MAAPLPRRERSVTDPAAEILLRSGDLELELHPAAGGRLARLRHHGVDLVLPPGAPHGIYGDTLWPSPQARWEWPPPPALDSGPYEVLSASTDFATLRSGPDESVGLSVVKRIALSPFGVDFSFTMTNLWSTEQRVAPWQVTRAAREGLLVWAEGEPFTDADRVLKHQEDPPCFFRHRELPGPFEGVVEAGELGSMRVPSVTRTSKYFTDARGWLAHLHRDRLMLRLFPDLSTEQPAPRQAEVELYVDLERDYIEMENQGAYVRLAPGASLDYRTRWVVGEVDPGLPTDRVTEGLRSAITDLARLGGASLAGLTG